MSTSTLKKDKPKARPAAGKCETLAFDLILEDRSNQLIKQPRQQAIVSLTFNVLGQYDDYVAVELDSFYLEEPLQLKLHKGSYELGTKDAERIAELILLEGEDNVETLVMVLRRKGYRISLPQEFKEWHEKHCLNYRNDASQPTTEGISGGLINLGTHRKALMLEAGYARKNGHINVPSQSDLETELYQIFADGKRTKRAALLLKRI